MRCCSFGALAILGAWGISLTFVSWTCKDWSRLPAEEDSTRTIATAAFLQGGPKLETPSGSPYYIELANLRTENAQLRKSLKKKSPSGPAAAALSNAPVPLTVRNRHLVIDIGFNEGGDAYHYLSHGYDVVGVEANPHMITKASADPVFKSFIATGQLKLIQAGISGPDDTDLTFWEHPTKSYWGQLGKPHGACKDSTKDPPRNDCIAHKVPMMTCQQVIDKMGVPLYMKVDIEKQDGDCILSLEKREDFCQQPFYVSFERSAKFQAAMKHLGDLGYKYFKQVLQKEWDRKQRFTSIKQASGPFGEWAMDGLTARAGTEQLGHLWKYSNNSEAVYGKNERPPGDWVDIHARLDGPAVSCERPNGPSTSK